MKKLLITGGSSFVGRNLCRDLAQQFEVNFTYNKNFIEIPNCKSVKLDITKEHDVSKLIQKISPSVVLHLAAVLTDECETNKEKAYETNFAATSKIADICKKENIKFIFTSTSYVFDGKKGMYKEEDTYGPVNYYGQTKVLAEEHIKKNLENFLIFRLSYPYGIHGDNVLNWFFDQVKQNKEVNAIVDQITSPTSTLHISKAISRAIEKDTKGIFHISDESRVNKLEFFRTIAEVFNSNVKINPINSSQIKQPAQRPKDSSLDISKVKKELGKDIFTDLRTALIEIKNLIQ